MMLRSVAAVNRKRPKSRYGSEFAVLAEVPLAHEAWRAYLIASPSSRAILGAMASPFTLYRTMRADADGLPVLGRAFSTLGVQISGPSADVRVLDDGTIMPESGGMSAFIDPRKMPKSLRPRTLTEKPGESPHPVFKLDEPQLPPALRFRKDKDYHGLVEPRAQCKIEEYEDQLGATRSDWKVAYAAPQ